MLLTGNGNADAWRAVIFGAIKRLARRRNFRSHQAAAGPSQLAGSIVPGGRLCSGGRARPVVQMPDY